MRIEKVFEKCKKSLYKDKLYWKVEIDEKEVDRWKKGRLRRGN